MLEHRQHTGHSRLFGRRLLAPGVATLALQPEPEAGIVIETELVADAEQGTADAVAAAGARSVD